MGGLGGEMSSALLPLRRKVVEKLEVMQTHCREHGGIFLGSRMCKKEEEKHPAPDF